MEEAEEIPNYKVVVVGPYSVGKTCLIKRLTSNAFDSLEPPTIGSACITHVVDVKGTPIKLSIWDTAGQERYRSLTPSTIRGAKCVVIVFKVNSIDTFHAATEYVTVSRGIVGENVPIYFVGNQTDTNASFDLSLARSFASMHHLSYWQVSAESGESTKAFFDDLIVTLSLIPPDIEPHNQTSQDSEKEKKCC